MRTAPLFVRFAWQSDFPYPSYTESANHKQIRSVNFLERFLSPTPLCSQRLPERGLVESEIAMRAPPPPIRPCRSNHSTSLWNFSLTNLTSTEDLSRRKKCVTSSNISVLTDVIAYVPNDNAARQDPPGLKNIIIPNTGDCSPTIGQGHRIYFYRSLRKRGPP